MKHFSKMLFIALTLPACYLYPSHGSEGDEELEGVDIAIDFCYTGEKSPTKASYLHLDLTKSLKEQINPDQDSIYDYIQYISKGKQKPSSTSHKLYQAIIHNTHSRELRNQGKNFLQKYSKGKLEWLTFECYKREHLPQEFSNLIADIPVDELDNATSINSQIKAKLADENNKVIFLIEIKPSEKFYTDDRTSTKNNTGNDQRTTTDQDSFIKKMKKNWTTFAILLAGIAVVGISYKAKKGNKPKSNSAQTKKQKPEMATSKS